MKILAIDYGEKRIGLASADTILKIPFSRGIIENTPNWIEKLKKVCKEENIQKIIFGHPKKMSEGVGEHEENYIKISKTLEESIQIPIELVDERFSSKLSMKQMNEVGISQKKQRDQKDDLAAINILDLYLQSI